MHARHVRTHIYVAMSVGPNWAIKRGWELVCGYHEVADSWDHGHNHEKWGWLSPLSVKATEVAFTQARSAFDGIVVYPSTPEDHLVWSQSLKKVDYHVKKLAEDRPLGVVLRRLDTIAVSTDEAKILRNRILPFLYVMMRKIDRAHEIFDLKEVYRHCKVEAKEKSL